MRPPSRNLPSTVEPWGRYIDGLVVDTNALLDGYERGIASNAASSGGITNSMSKQVKSLDAASIVTVTMDNFSRAVPPTPVGGTPQYAYSPIVSASMPTGAVANSCRLIVNFDVTDDQDTTIADRGELFMRVNGQYAKDPRTWGPGGSGLISYVPARSGMMLSTEQALNYESQFCMRIASYGVSGTVTFSNIRFTYIFYGAI